MVIKSIIVFHIKNTLFYRGFSLLILIGLISFKADLISAQTHSASITKLNLKDKVRYGNSISWPKRQPTPQLKKINKGFVFTYLDEDYNSHLLFLDSAFNTISDRKYPKKGFINVCTDNKEIAILTCKYELIETNKDGSKEYASNLLYFEIYDQEGNRKSSVRILGDKDKYYDKHLNARKFSDGYTSSLIHYNDSYYASFEYNYRKTRKYSTWYTMLLQIRNSKDIYVINSETGRNIERKILVNNDTLYYLNNSGRNPRAIVLQKYAIEDINKAEVEKVLINKKTKESDNVLKISAKKIVLIEITDGIDDSDFLCNDNMSPLQMNKVFIWNNQLNIVMNTKQDLKSYDIILTKFRLNGNKISEQKLAANRRLHETGAYVSISNDSLWMAYHETPIKGDKPEKRKLLIMNLDSIQTEISIIEENFIRKPVFQFHPNSRVNKRLLYAMDFAFINQSILVTDNRLLLLYFDYDNNKPKPFTFDNGKGDIQIISIDK